MPGEVVNYGGKGDPNVQPPFAQMVAQRFGLGRGRGFGRFGFTGDPRKRLLGATGLPGDPNYFVSSDSLLGDKPFNYANLYGASLPGGGGGGLPGFRPVRVSREDFGSLSPEEQQRMVGAPRAELERLSAAVQRIRGIRSPGRLGIGFGFGEGDFSPDLRRLILQRLGVGF